MTSRAAFKNVDLTLGNSDFLPGFSTAEKFPTCRGRRVGNDVGFKTNIEKELVVQSTCKVVGEEVGNHHQDQDSR